MESFTDGVQQLCQMYRGVEGFCLPEQCLSIQNFISAHPEIRVIGEIGFNVGMSAASMLAIRPEAEVWSFDLFINHYSQMQHASVEKHFPKRLRLIMGDSTVTVPAFQQLVKEPCFDFVFVDGGHVDPVPRLDIQNMLKLLKPGGFLCVDDYCEAFGHEGVIEAYDEAVANGQIKTLSHEYADNRGWVFAQKLS